MEVSVKNVRGGKNCLTSVFWLTPAFLKAQTGNVPWKHPHGEKKTRKWHLHVVSTSEVACQVVPAHQQPLAVDRVALLPIKHLVTLHMSSVFFGPVGGGQ